MMVIYNDWSDCEYDSEPHEEHYFSPCCGTRMKPTHSQCPACEEKCVPMRAEDD